MKKDDGAGDLLRRYQRTRRQPLALESKVERLRAEERALERIVAPLAVFVGALIAQLRWIDPFILGILTAMAFYFVFRVVVGLYFIRKIEKSSRWLRR